MRRLKTRPEQPGSAKESRATILVQSLFGITGVVGEVIQLAGALLLLLARRAPSSSAPPKAGTSPKQSGGNPDDPSE